VLLIPFLNHCVVPSQLLAVLVRALPERSMARFREKTGSVMQAFGKAQAGQRACGLSRGAPIIGASADAGVSTGE